MPSIARIAARAYPWLVRNRYRLPHALVHGVFRIQDRLSPCPGGTCRSR